MGITVEFKSFDEMVAFAGQLLGSKPVVEEKKEAVKKVTPVIKNEAPAEDEALAEEEQPAGEETKTYTLEEIRAALAVHTRNGKQKQVKDLLTSFNAKNLSSIDPKYYAALMEKAGEI